MLTSMLQGFRVSPSPVLGAGTVNRTLWGRIMHSIINTIRRTLPKTFVLENVVGFQQHAGGRTYNQLLRKLTQIKDGSTSAYEVQTAVFEYNGLRPPSV